MKIGRRISPLLSSPLRSNNISSIAASSPIQFFSEDSERDPRQNSNFLSSSLQHYIQSDHPTQGQKFHAHFIKTGYRFNTNISIKLLILYIRCGFLTYARRVFDEMRSPTVSSFNSMIAAYVKQNQLEESMSLIKRMTYPDEKPDGYTFSMILKLSTTGTFISTDLAKEVHTQILKSCIETDDILSTALIDSYCKKGEVDYARKVFDKLYERNVVCSTAMITGYMKQGSFVNAEEIFAATVDKDTVVFNAMIEGYSKSIKTAAKSLQVYIEMQRVNFRPTISTFVSVLGACSVLASHEVGEQVQGQLMKTELFSDVKLGSALIDMYSKCGKTEEAQRIFDYMPDKNVFSWTSMIDGFGKNGMADKALDLFKKMTKENRIRPNYVTILSALSACGHAGFVKEGWEIFNNMERDFLIKPRMEHYSCMVDLLGRAGSLQEALEFIVGMPEKPNSDVWAALLGASTIHGDVELADFAAKELFKISSKERPGAYMALSNTFAAAGKWEGVSEVRKLMKSRGVSKVTGCSWE
ncbi:hypothetical protein MKX03_006770 [Papaver bracteatum]|nr:hypothetical protein MKX03_006770 [Papaver bracteatum]